MSHAIESNVLDRLLEPLSKCLDSESSQRLAEFRIDPDIEQTVQALAERANEGLLTDAERADYESLINAADFISILKLKAKRNLASSGI